LCNSDLTSVQEFEKFVKKCDYDRFEHLLKILRKRHYNHAIAVSRKIFNPVKKGHRNKIDDESI